MSTSIGELPAQAAHRFGDAPVLSLIGGRSWSFAEIDGLAARFAGWLAGEGVGRGDRVVVYLPNSVDWVVAYYAIARLGAVVVPANFLLTTAEVAFMIRDAEAAVIVLPSERADAVIRKALGSGMVVELPQTDQECALPLGYPIAPAKLAPDDLFMLGYTSGTTGRPKGAMLSHGNVFASTSHTATVHIRSSVDTVLSALPFPHVYGNVVLNTAFLAGLRLVVMPRFEAGAALAAIDNEKPTLFEGVPTMFYQMLAHPAAASTDFSSLTRCTVGGQTMPVTSLDEVVRVFGCPVCELWGMTEVAGPATSHSPYWPARHGSIGLPFPSVEVRVASLDNPSRDVPDGTAGELCVRGPLVTSGYWRNPEATAAAIDRDGWLATGDIGLRDPDGYLRIVDRRKDLIITGGYNIYPAEVEQVLAAHPAVAMSAVAGRPDPERGELAHAFVVLRPTARATPQDLELHCRRHLAPYKVPRAIVLVDDLPKTSTGKILRRALRDVPVPHLAS